ncbi:MAG: hypothetical protein RBG13Loki_2244 [Promethearchaeota archaeon CR_4]|nr:MAG: hypothetical protein RBG13Loki_2244 [Candidatus Lokiarchaeota archaeon CR_4]
MDELYERLIGLTAGEFNLSQLMAALALGLLGAEEKDDQVKNIKFL